MLQKRLSWLRLKDYLQIRGLKEDCVFLENKTDPTYLKEAAEREVGQIEMREVGIL